MKIELSIDPKPSELVKAIQKILDNPEGWKLWDEGLKHDKTDIRFSWDFVGFFWLKVGNYRVRPSFFERVELKRSGKKMIKFLQKKEADEVLEELNKKESV